MGPAPLKPPPLPQPLFPVLIPLYNCQSKDLERIVAGGANNGVVQVDGEKWREQRRFALHVLRDFGVGKSLMETAILDEVSLI